MWIKRSSRDYLLDRCVILMRLTGNNVVQWDCLLLSHFGRSKVEACQVLALQGNSCLSSFYYNLVSYY